MIWRKRRKLALTSFLLLFYSTTIFADLTLFKSGEHCVAYKVKKRLALIRTVDVIGRNCDVTAMVLPDLKDLYYVQLEIPIKSFASGESERDRDVEKLLGIKKQDNLTFKSQKLKKADWLKAFKKKDLLLEGEIFISGANYPVKTKINLIKNKKGYEVEALFNGEFKDFALKPPELAAGFAAKVLPDLALHIRLQAEQTLGAEAILPSP